jgi:hypothetical protein
MIDAHYLARLLLALAAICLLALTLYPDAGCRGCGADVVRDRVFLGVGR